MKNKFITLILICIFALSCSTIVFADNEMTINVSDPPQVGSANITVLMKKHFEPNHPSTQSLAGAVFEVKHYANTSGNTSGTPIHTWYFETEDLQPDLPLETDGKYGISGLNPKLASGYTSDALIPYDGRAHVWPLGTYTIKEVEIPTSYQLNTETRTFIVSYNSGGGKFDAFVRTPEGTSWESSSDFDVDEPENDKVSIDVYKGDEENQEIIPQGNGNLSGIRFAVVLRSQDEYVYYDKPQVKRKNGEVVEILTTNEDGYAITAPDTTVGNSIHNLRFGTYELIELRKDSTVAVGDMYDSLGEDKLGKSIYANSSYLFSALRQTKDCKQNKTTIHFGNTTLSPESKTGFANPVVRGGVHVYKKDIEINKYTPQGDASLAGIRFAIVNRSTEKVLVDGTNRQPGQVVKIITTNEAGEAWTDNECLPYGLYDIFELHADATIQPGDVYDGSNKLGSSIYANSQGVAGIAERDHGSMLWADQHENFAITYEHEMVGMGTRRSDSGDEGEVFREDDQRVHYENRVVRGGFEAYKVDKETMISYPLEGASLAGIEFTLKNASKREVKVNGIVYQPGDVIPDANFTTDSHGNYVWITDEKGWIGCNNQYLPYGTYTLQETKTNLSYKLTDSEPHEFHIRIEKQVVGKDDDSFLTTKEETQALINKWVGSTNFPQANLVYPDQVYRGPLEFTKKDPNGQPMVDIPWKITNTTTGEVHYILSDNNGHYDSDLAPHSHRTNAIDDIFRPFDEQTNPRLRMITNEAIQQAKEIDYDSAEPHDYYCGLWFSLSKDGSTHAPVDDELGALPYGHYILEELLCEANQDRALVTRDFFIKDDNGALLGTVENPRIVIETKAQDIYTNSPYLRNAQVENVQDVVTMSGLDVAKEYRLETEVHYVTGSRGHHLDEGIVTDNAGTPLTNTTYFTPTSTDSYRETVMLTFDSRNLYCNGTQIKGGELVIYEYLYEVVDNNPDNDVYKGSHIDPNDTNQMLIYPWFKTHLTGKTTGLRMEFAKDGMVLNDTISYYFFNPGARYHVTGKLYFQDTGTVVKDLDGNDVVVDEDIIADGTPQGTDLYVNGTFNVEYRSSYRYKLDKVMLKNGVPVDMEGQTVVSCITIDAGNNIVLQHNDKNDEEQTVHIPKIRTVAKDKDTQDDVGKVVGTFVDTVTYENLLPGLNFDMICELMDKDSNSRIGQTNHKEFITTPNSSDPRRSDGEIAIEVPLTLTKAQLEGKDLVAFEELYVKADQENGYPIDDTKVAEHKDINDATQTVNYPKIRTLAVDEFTEDHVGTVTGSTTVIDTVEYWNLVEGRSYTIEGSLYDVNGTPIATATPFTFTATAEDVEHGTKTIRFPIDSSSLDDHTVVVYEKLIHNDVEVTQHEENNDETQRIHYPWMNTTAIDSETGDHVGTIKGRLINAFRRLTGENVEDTVYQKVIDRVDYRNTLVSESYTFEGKIMNKDTGEPILGDDGQPITGTATINAGQHGVDGHVNIEFSVDSSKLENVTIVCYEKMFHNNANTGEPVEVNRHEDINDEYQSVHDVEISTTAVDTHTGDHVGDASKATTISDKVDMKNLVNGMEYTLVGTPYVKETGEKLTNADGSLYTPVTKTFTVTGGTEENWKVDMSQTLTFNVNGLDLQDKTIVIFEDLYHNGVRITTHSDIADEDQSVHYPKVLTTAKDSKTKDHVGTVNKPEKIVDVVELKNLIPGQKYIVSGKLMIHGTETPLLDENGQEIVCEKEFTADARDMTIEINFDDLDTTIYRGKTTVAFEKLYHPYENTGDRVEVANHEEPNDEVQSVHWPDISTHAIDKDTGGHVGNISKTAVVKDKVTVKNLIPGMKYTISGTLHFQNNVYDENGNITYHKGDAVQKDGQDLVVTKEFTAEQADEEHILQFEVDSTLLEGATVVAFEKLYHPENNVGTLVEVVQHEDIDDEEQSVHYPRVDTKATDGITYDHVGATEQNTIKDEAEYWNLIPGQKYRIKGTMMNKRTGEPLVINGNEVVSDTGWFTVESWEAEYGVREITFDIDASELDGETVVCFEKLYTPQEEDWTDTDKEPIVEVEITNHEDINDEDQSVHYPKVTTSARDKYTDDHVGTVITDDQVKDTVTLENLIPGQKYTLIGKLHKFGTTQPIVYNGDEVTATETFTAENETEVHELVFTEYDTNELRGETVVVFEYLYHPRLASQLHMVKGVNPTDIDPENVEVATHEVPDEELQAVHYPWIRTIAVDTETGDHVGTILGRLINSFRRVVGQDVPDDKFAGIIDTVEYKNLIPDQEYTITGTLMNKETGEKVLDEEGKEITSSVTLEANKHEANGEAKVYFELDTSRLENVTVVCFEKLFHNNAKTNEPVEIDRHEDLNDEDQSVHNVKIRTHAVDEHIALEEAHYDWHTGDATGNTIINDDVTLNNLVNGMEYTLKGTLHYKDTGEPVLDSTGQPYETILTFKVEEDTEDTRVDLVKRISFSVDGKALEGRTVVAFEELYHNDVLITVHTDINDEDQSVYYPWIRTNATNKVNGAKEIQVTENTEVIDKVTYKNLLPGKYKLTGILMDKNTGEDLIDSKGNKVTQELEFTIASVEEGKEGSKDLVFTFDSTTLASHIVVAYETLVLLDENNPEYEVPVAEHKDLNDEEQSIWIIDIATHLTDMMTNSDEGEAREKAEWNDHVSYLGLKPGKEYTLKGILMDKETGEPFVDHNGNTVTSEIKFTPENKDGFVDLKFEADTRDLAGHSVVAFEELYPEDLPDTVIAEHKDITDKDQTVNIVEIRTNATDSASTSHMNVAGPESIITDRVTYTNLTLGREYILRAKLMDKNTGEPVLVNEQEVVLDQRFIPEEPNGYIDVPIPVNTETLEGVTVVVFEQLFNAEYPEVVVAHHEDITDEDQSVHIPKIRTTLGKINADRTVVDTVLYENLIPGIEYTVKGYFVEKFTGNKLEESDGTIVFTPTEPNGSIDMTLSAKSNETIVAFEELYIKVDAPTPTPEVEPTEPSPTQEVNEVLVAKHNDLNDEAQTAIQFNIKVLKADKKKTDHYLEGAEITVFDMDGNVIQNPDGTDCIGTTDENGEVTIPVLHTSDTSYYIQETKAPEGYEINDTKFDANPDNLESDPMECTITILDGALVIPPTGDYTTVLIYMIMLVLMLGIGGSMIIYRKKKLQ